MECHKVASRLRTTCEDIRGPARKVREAVALKFKVDTTAGNQGVAHPKVSTSSTKKQSSKAAKAVLKSTQMLDAAIAAFKATWKESEIEETMSKLDSLKGQLILRMLLALDNKADQTVSRFQKHEKILSENSSNIIEILGIYQNQTQSSLRRETGRILDRLDSTEKAFAAVLTMRNGDTQIFRQPDASPGMMRSLNSRESGSSSSGQKMFRLRSADESNSFPEVVVREFKPLQMQTAILRSLTFRQIADRFDMVDTPYNETYDWIFCDPNDQQKPWSSFPRWLSETQEDTCYWISGKAGSGKSTLMKYISQDPRFLAGLNQWVEDNRLIVTSFFFRGLGTELQKSQEGLLRSILFDALSRDPHLISTIMHELCFLTAGSGNETTISTPSLTELMKWMRRLLSIDNSVRYCFLIDGIDEYDGDPSIIVDLVSSLSHYKTVKFLLSSRPIPVCVDNFSDFPMLRLQDLTYDDIRQYAEGHLMPRLQKRAHRPAEYGALVDQIVEKSCGVFIWVVLSVKSLLRGLENRDRFDELQTRLEELPSDLADLYSHMMKKMSHLYRTQAANLFRLTMATLDSKTQQRECPFLTLQASFVEDRADYLDVEIMQISEEDEQLRCDEIEGRIRSRCCGLLETRRPLPSERELTSFSRYEYPCVDFLHRTVVEFLRDERVWKGIVEQSEVDYNPPVLLFHSCVRMCKILPSTAHISNLESPMWQMMRRALAFASRAEDAQTPILRANLEDLDRTVSYHWKAAKLFFLGEGKSGRYETTGRWAKKLRFTEVAESTYQEDSEWVLSETIGPVDFSSVAIAHSLSSYFFENANAGQLDAAGQRSNDILLYRASGMFLRWAWYGQNAPQRYDRAIDICERLLGKGSDPGIRLKTVTGHVNNSVWELVLEYATQGGSIAEARRHASNGLYDEAGDGFVRGFVRLVMSLVQHGVDVNREMPPRVAGGHPRLPLSILEEYLAGLGKLARLRSGGDPFNTAIHDGDITTLIQEVFHLMILKGAQPEVRSYGMAAIQVPRQRSAMEEQQPRPISGVATMSSTSNTALGSITTTSTEASMLVATPNSDPVSTKLYQRLTNKIRFLKPR